MKAFMKMTRLWGFGLAVLFTWRSLLNKIGWRVTNSKFVKCTNRYCRVVHDVAAHTVQYTKRRWQDEQMIQQAIKEMHIVKMSNPYDTRVDPYFNVGKAMREAWAKGEKPYVMGLTPTPTKSCEEEARDMLKEDNDEQT